MSPPPSSFPQQIRLALARGGIPGCSIAVVSRAGLVWSGAFGYADLASRRPAEPDTVYHLFSGTKLFTATAVVRLAERGRLALEDPLARFLPDIEDGADIRLLHLLSHTSGLGDSLRSFLAVTLPPASVPRSAEALSRYPIRRQAPPGGEVVYRNVNYALLGEVVTRASGVEYTDYVGREILEPLGMQATFGITDSMRPRLATGYVDRWDPMRAVLWMLFPETRGRLYGGRIGGRVELRDYDLATPAIGGLVGSVLDFGRFLTAHLDAGGPVLSPESTARMQTRIGSGAAGIESRDGTGLGWKIGRVDGRTFLNHEGGGAGYTSELRLYPDAGVGIAIAMNAMRMPKTMRLAHHLCEILFAAHDRLDRLAVEPGRGT